jgi:predicted ferric reductase
MKPIQFYFAALMLLLTALWLAADTFAFQSGYFAFRAAFMQYSGIVAIGAMSVALILAARPRWLEPRLRGLDKMYRLHKWLGIAALVAAIAHWWFGQGTKWMVGWGWLTRPQRHGGHDAGDASGFAGWLHGLHGTAETVGEWAFYAVTALIVLALLKRFPYHLFRKTHTWLAAGYLALVFHAVVLLKPAYWSQPVGWVLAVLLAGGTGAALWILAGRHGVNRRVQGRIETVASYPGLKVTETAIVLDRGWPGHLAGQFAFVTTNADEGPHPYTIASAWNPADRRIVFLTKALGDHTGRLAAELKAGLPVTVEGPYGCFDFRDTQPRQIWVGAGIGITPFVARLKQLAGGPAGQDIDLFHSTADFDPAAIDRLVADAAAAGVRLHVRVDRRDGRLTPQAIRAAVPDWKNASVWFCGPPGFGRTLRRDFLGHGLPAGRFHQELFQMR